VQITALGVFGDNVQIAAFQKCFAVTKDVAMFDACQNTHFVDGIFPFSFFQGFQGNFFQSVFLFVRFANDFVHRTVRAFAQQFDNLEIFGSVGVVKG
jgi:hypothetical protein